LMPVHLHTGLYEKQDLIELLERQEAQSDNRMEQAELVLAERALKFGDRLVRDRLVPRRVVKTVSADENIGPLLMDELHKSGHSRFPVFEGKKDNITGTLYMKDLVKSKHGGTVAKAMRSDVCYIHEEQPLFEALQAVLKTHHHLMVVVNSFEEYVGVISLEDVLEELIGQPIIDEFDQYHDLRAVAAKMAADEHEDHEKATSEAQEMIESQHDTDPSISSTEP
ncbi:MAG: CBS domain-containing protein, partial [Patescibacteria group bacterium]